MTRIIAKRINIYPVPNKEELRLFFNYLNKKPLFWKLFFVIACCQGLRAKEILNLTWDNFKYDHKRQAFTELSYLAYKPRRYATTTDNTLMYKIITMPIYSRYLSNLLKEYHNTVACHYNSKRLFHFCNPGSCAKIFERLRKETINNKDFDGFREKVTETLFGGDKKTIYKIGVHSFRRFCITYHYYMTFNQDIVRTAKAFGHSHVQTTYDHYVFPRNSISLDNEDIDDFLFSEDHKQIKITFYQDIIKKPFVIQYSSSNQKTILEY